MPREIKAFIIRGNVMDLSVGVIIGGAFTFGSAKVTYGNFINNLIDFIIIGLVIFLMIKGINNLQKKPTLAPASASTTKECPVREPGLLRPHCFTTILIQATRCLNCTSEL
jgi:large conductance mechanosensitive channel